MRFLAVLLSLFGASGRFAASREAEFRAMLARADAEPLPDPGARPPTRRRPPIVKRLGRGD